MEFPINLFHSDFSLLVLKKCFEKPKKPNLCCSSVKEAAALGSKVALLCGWPPVTSNNCPDFLSISANMNVNIILN